MPDRDKEIAKELARLLREGRMIRLSEAIRLHSKPEREKLVKGIKTAERKQRKAAKNNAKERELADQNRLLLELIDAGEFGRHYQDWYSEALRAVEQLLRDRYDEFRELYRLDKKPKELDVTTYTISEYIQGTTVSRGGVSVFETGPVALGKVQTQVDILASAQSRLDSLLADIAGTLEATLLDDELETAGELLKARHVRSAGVVAGVVLERHLKTVAANHRVKLGQKNPQISGLNDALKKANVFDNPRWREIQRLGDIRNLCAHDGEREPKPKEVRELIEGTDRIIKTVF